MRTLRGDHIVSRHWRRHQPSRFLHRLYLPLLSSLRFSGGTFAVAGPCAPPPPFFSILLCSTSLLNYSTVLSAAHISALSIFHDWLTTCIAAHIQGVDAGIRNNNGQTAIEFLRATLMGEVADYIQSRVDAIAAGKVRENDIG